MPPESAVPSSASPAPRRKSTLFCPECWHENPVDGDWRVQETATHERLGCPVCGATVTERPAKQRKETPATRSSTDNIFARSFRLLSWMMWPCPHPDNYGNYFQTGRAPATESKCCHQ